MGQSSGVYVSAIGCKMRKMTGEKKISKIFGRSYYRLI